MKINDLIVESQQLDELSTAGIAKGVGKIAKGVGSVVGGAAGAFDAAKQGFQAGRSAVAGGGAAKPATTAADANAQGPDGTAPAQTQTGAAGAALAKSAQAVAAAPTDAKQGDALYAQVKASIGQLDPVGKKKILQLVQKSMAEQPAEPAAPQQSIADKVAAAQAPVAEPAGKIEPTMDPAQTPKPQAAAPAELPAGGKGTGQNFDPQTGKPISQYGQQQAAAPATQEPAPQQQSGGKLTPAQQAAMKAKLQGKRAAGQTAGTTASGFNKYTKDASSQRIVGANPDGSPKIQQIKASKINLGSNLSESLAEKIEIAKRKMFESDLVNGAASLFKK